MGFWDGTGISRTICKQSAPHSKQYDSIPGGQLTESEH